MKITWEEYCDKVYAAWIGKNIGGTFGAPYEGGREYLDIKDFASEAGAPLPNDDLDLQLIWLHAIEKLGPARVNAQTLGEMWMSFIPAHWNEYGNCKVNMLAGLPAPISGDYNNEWKHSNGAWIRTEIWACLAPAAPEVAAKYAIFDASVDHGTGEGTAAAAFVAAMESAAFLEKNLRKLIAVGLAAIPAESRMADTIRHLLECYDGGMTAREARDSILARNADIGDGWFEAPSNVAYAVLGLLYGEGDFKRSLIAAVNCGDDTDCTGATVGALLGIMGGTASLPEDWRAHVGDDIVSIAINSGLFYPYRVRTCTELAKRVIRQMPAMYLAHRREIATTEDGQRYITAPDNAADEGGLWQKSARYIEKDISSRKPFAADYTFGPIEAVVRTNGAPEIRAGGEIEVEVLFRNLTEVYGNCPYGLRLSWLLPEGFSVESEMGERLYLPHHNSHTPKAEATYRARIIAPEAVPSVSRAVLEVEIEGRPTVGYLPITLLG